MKNIISLSIFFLLTGLLFFSGSPEALALKLSDKQPSIGQSVFVLDPVANNFYSVFWTNLDGPKSDPCAYIAGTDLVLDNDLTNYGTCFINDNGSYQVVELSGDFMANYNDSLQSNVFVNKTNLVVQNKFLFAFSLSNGGNKFVTSGNSITNSVAVTLTAADFPPNPVYFTVLGLPDGATAFFTPDQCTPTCMTTLSISTSTLTPDGAYTITVIGSAKGAETKTTSFILTVDNTAPVITVTNPTTTPAQSKTVTASTNEGTLTMSVNSGGICNSTLAFTAYAPTTFSSESDNGKTICYKAVDSANNTTFNISSAIGGIDTTAPTTTATPSGGLYGSAQSVVLTTNEVANIYFTTDGSTPTITSTLYTVVIPIPDTTTLKFFAQDTVGNSEAVKTEIYTIDTNIGVLSHFLVEAAAGGNILTQTAGVPFDIKITAKDANGNIITNFTSTVALSNDLSDISPVISGSFEAGIWTQSVTLIRSGNDSITATASGKSGSSNNFTVNSGPTANFILNSPDDITVGRDLSRAAYSVTRRDQFNNLVTSGTDTINLSSSSNTGFFFDAASDGDEITSFEISVGSIAYFWYGDDTVGDWIITASSGGELNTDNITVSITPITPTKFIIETLVSDTPVSSVVAGTSVTVKVTTVNNSNVLASSYNRNNLTLTLLASPSGNSSTVGSGIAFNVINGISYINESDLIVITNQTSETITLSVQDTSDVPLNTDFTKELTFSPGPLNHFVISEITSPKTSGESFNITMTAKDEFGNTVVDFIGTADLSINIGAIIPTVSGTFASGIRTETVTTTLSTSNNVKITATRTGGLETGESNEFTVEVEGTEPPQPPEGGGGGGGSPASAPAIVFSGQAFPSGLLTAFVISEGNIPLKQDIIKTADGKFNLSFISNLTGIEQYGIFVTDPNGLTSQARIYTLKDGVPSLDIKGLLMSPTVGLLRSVIGKGDFLTISGYATPGSMMEFEVDGILSATTTTALVDGSYKILWNTATLNFGKHTLRVRQTTKEGITSEFSPTKNFDLKNYIITSTDYNADGKVGVQDASIFLSLWYNRGGYATRSMIDLNKDGQINLQDLSMFLRTLRK